MSKLTDQLFKMAGFPPAIDLNRSHNPWTPTPIDNEKVDCFGSPEQIIFLNEIVKDLGGKIFAPKSIDAACNYFVLDATGFESLSDINKLYGFFQGRMKNLRSHGRLIILSKKDQEVENPAARIAQKAIEGFMRSMSKEVGRKGTTVNQLRISKALLADKENYKTYLKSALHFLFSTGSTFITGQQIDLDVPAKRNEDSIPLTQSLKGKTALVTGAAQGIGEAIARCLAKEGAHVVVLDRPADEDKAKAVAEAIDGVVLLQDVSSEDAGKAIGEFVQKNFDGLDILIHNAGITRDKTLKNMTREQWDMVLNINLHALYNITNTLLDANLLNTQSRVVCMSSIMGIGGNFGQTNYGATKAGVIGLVEAFAGKMATKQSTINAIAPGFIQTRMTDKIPFFTREIGKKMASLNQEGLPVDIAETVTFLCSPGAASINGQTIRVCGGSVVGK